MTLKRPEISALFSMKPEGALRYLELKGLRIITDPSLMLAQQHAYAHSFANLTRLDVAQDIVNALKDAMKNGQTEQEFIKNLEPILRKKGWWGSSEHINTSTGEITKKQLGNAGRLGTIYRNNMQSAYMSGRYESMIANAHARPYWRYVAVMDSVTRPSHAALHNKVFHYLDPIWNVIFPPCGHRCRCRIVAMTEAEVKAQGYTISSSQDLVTRDVVTGYDDEGNPITTPVQGIRFVDDNDKLITFYPDAGFDYNPGKAIYSANLDKYNDELLSPFIHASLNSSELSVMHETALAGQITGQVIPAAVINAARQELLSITTKVAWINETTLANSSLSVAQWAMIQQVIEQATLIIGHTNGVSMCAKINNQWYQAVLDTRFGATVTHFSILNESQIPALINSGHVLEGAI